MKTKYQQKSVKLKSHFIQQNLIIWNNFYQFAITSKNKIPLINLFWYVSIINRSSPTKTILLQTKIKRFPQLFELGPQIPLKRKWHHFFPWSPISAILDTYVCKYKNANICKGLLQSTCLILINVGLNFLLKLNPYFYQYFMTII